MLMSDLKIFSPTVNTVFELEAPRPSSGAILEYFSQLSEEEDDKIMAAVKPTT